MGFPSAEKNFHDNPRHVNEDEEPSHASWNQDILGDQVTSISDPAAANKTRTHHLESRFRRTTDKYKIIYRSLI